MANYFGALSSMIFGSISYILFISFNLKILNFHCIVPSLSFSFIAFLAGNFIGEKNCIYKMM